MGCFVVAEFLLMSASRSPSATAEPLVFTLMPSIWCKNRENRSSRSWDSFAQIKKKETTEGKTYSPVGRFAEWAKKGSYVMHCGFVSLTVSKPLTYSLTANSR